MRRAVFLDRDGVICENRSDYVRGWDEFVFIPGSRQALARLARSDLRVVVVTNQSAINRHIVSEAIVEHIHTRMTRAIAAAGGHVDLIMVCPHRPDEGCDCRKPKPGLLVKAAAELDIALSRSYLIGDATSDIAAGQAVGAQSFLVMTGRGRRELARCRRSRTGFKVAADLEIAVDDILRDGHGGRIRPSAPQERIWKA